MKRHRSRGAALAAAVLIALGVGRVPAASSQTTPPTGRVAGRVVDKANGRPMASVRISLVGKAGVVESDLDGRFRTPPVEVGIYGVRAALIGFKPVVLDSVKVTAGQTTTVSMALEIAPVQLEELTVASDAPKRISSSAGLLAAQQNAMAVVDGISAETISRTADSDAGQAVLRVTGLSVVEDKVVVRGLSERYSNSQLNGVEIASPEPDKKFVSLDVFAASLIESIVAAKTATPDRPGDFAGGTVDIQTKEFPDNFIFSVGFSQGYNSRATFKRFARTPRSGSDFLAFNGSSRGFPLSTSTVTERFAESLSNVWTPAATKARPDLGVDLAVGGRQDFGSDALGYILSLNYGSGREYNPDRYDAEGEAPFRFEESAERVELAGIGNLTYRRGSNHKFGFKNFYSRSSEETVRQGVGGDSGDGPSLNYQVSYIEQYVTQSQLTGDHFLPGLGNSRLEWKASLGRANRGDLDNRQLRYIDNGSGFQLTNRRPQFRGTNELFDRSYSGQVDWSLPFGLRAAGDALIKVGGLYRRKNRQFDAISLELRAGPDLPGSYLSLPPEELLAPENLGPGLLSYTPLPILLPYTGTDRVTAGYALADFELLPAVRIVGGARVEKWFAELSEGEPPLANSRRKSDILWSTNLTYTASPTTNLRFAAYRTVARPDLRELSTGGYPAVVGGPPTIGNDSLKSSSILNGDIRFEVYPAAEELFALSLFYKRFTDPIVTTYRDAAGVVIQPDNGTKATSIGAEFEFRKRLGFITGLLEPFLLNGNVTVIRSRVDIPARLGLYADDLEFQGQSPYLVNLGLTYTPAKPNLSVSVLFNRFGQRIVRYPAGGTGAGATVGPNIIERPRSSLDAKIKVGTWNKISASLSGKNLLNSLRELAYDRSVGDGTAPPPILGRSLSGMSFSMGLSYAY